MYKILIVMNNEMGALEDLLNEYAEDSYKLVHAFQDNSRFIFIMEKQRGPGRPPSKKESESKLGD